MRARDKLVQLASREGGVLSVGSRSNRMRGSVRVIIPCEVDAPGAVSAECFQRFNRKEGVPAYRKPARLVQELRILFDKRPKLNEYQMREALKAMRAEDGSLLFCYDNRDTTGMVISEEQIKSWIGSETKR